MTSIHGEIIVKLSFALFYTEMGILILNYVYTAVTQHP